MVLDSVELPFKERLRLRGLSDAHIGARACHISALRRDIATIAEEEDSYVILLGDQMDAITMRDVRFRASSVAVDLIEDMDALLNAQLAEAVRIFAPIKSRIIGALLGNHEQKVLDLYGIDIHRLFCKELGIRDLGYSCLLRLTLARQFEGSEKKRNLDVYCHHGHGGNGRKTGASINRMEDLAAEWSADIYMMGHNHKKHTSSRPLLGINTNGAPQFAEKNMVFIRTGGYLKSFERGQRPTYSEKAGYSPLFIGQPPYVDVTLDTHTGLKMRVTE